MKLTIAKEDLIKPLQSVVAIADKKHTMPILNNLLIQVTEQQIQIKASDLETEIQVTVPLTMESEPGDITIPARKLMDIVRTLDNDAYIHITADGPTRGRVTSGSSKFTLTLQDPKNFPAMDEDVSNAYFKMPLKDLINSIKRVQFAMANNDVRYFLNGMLWEINEDQFRVVATDGHRMALSDTTINNTYLDTKHMLIPRKAVNELLKISPSNFEDQEANIQFGMNHFRISFEEYQFTSKLIDAHYPDYQRVIPKDNHKVLVADRLILKKSLTRTAILANEKYRGVRLQLDADVMTLSANNPEHEEAMDQIEVNYQDQPMEIGFNVNYLLDVLNVLDAEKVDLYLSDPTMSIIIKDETTNSRYIVMPIRL